MRIFFVMALLFLASTVSALSIESVAVDSVSPGEEGIIRVTVENDAEVDIEGLSFNLDFQNMQIIPIGSSEASLDTLEEDEEETFAFRFRVANDLPTGTYSIPYTITYEEDDDEENQSGTIGIVVSAEPELEIVVEEQSPIVGQTAELNVRVVNKGLADARFVSIFVDSEEITMLSENSAYIGTIESDDFESTSFDAIFNDRFATLSVRLTYKDFNNVDQEIVESASLRAYTRNEAVEKGILTRSNAPIYVAIILLLLVIWIVYRIIRRTRRKNKE